METILIKLTQLVLSFTILVLVHEFGHYLFARLFRVRVDKFYIFFNPWFSLFRFKPKGSDTEWGIGWLPLGGYCKINGMIDESLDDDHIGTEPQPYEFRSKPAWQRFLIMVAGVAFNFLLALFIYAGISYAWGQEELPSDKLTHGMTFSAVGHGAGFRDGDIIISADGRALDVLSSDFMRKVVEAHEVQVRRGEVDTVLTMPKDLMRRLLRDGRGLMSIRLPLVVSEVLAGQGAERAGLQAGDRLVAIEGVPYDDRSEAIEKINRSKGQVLTMSFERNGDITDFALPVDTAGRIGIGLDPNLGSFYDVHLRRYSLIEAVPIGATRGLKTLQGYVSDLRYVFTPEGASQIGGFGTIGNLFPATWNWKAFWSMTAFLSVMLAVMNLLPIPALDGGHILFLLIEMITRRRVSEKTLLRAQLIGMFVLFALLVYANVKDVIRLF